MVMVKVKFMVMFMFMFMVMDVLLVHCSMSYLDLPLCMNSLW